MQKFIKFLQSLNWEMIMGLLIVWCVIGAWFTSATASLIASDCGHPEVVATINYVAVAIWYLVGTIVVLALFTGVYLGDMAGQRQFDAERTRQS